MRVDDLLGVASGGWAIDGEGRTRSDVRAHGKEEGRIMNGFRPSLGVIALAVALLAVTLVVLDNWFLCRRLFFCAEQVVRWADGVNLVQNPSFEDPPALNPGNDFLPLPVGDTRLKPWTVVGTTGQNVALLQNKNSFGIVTPYQNRFLDLTGDNRAPDPKTGFFAGVQQNVSTVPREPYQLTFQIGLMTQATVGGQFRRL